MKVVYNSNTNRFYKISVSHFSKAGIREAQKLNWDINTLVNKVNAYLKNHPNYVMDCSTFAGIANLINPNYKIFMLGIGLHYFIKVGSHTYHTDSRSNTRSVVVGDYNDEGTELTLFTDYNSKHRYISKNGRDLFNVSAVTQLTKTLITELVKL